ncbi:MAG: hypothetical protein M0P97_02565 [Candidatus Moranbacteria bacterium]|jgi:hypothetical protein|nr:hypothetical protein [Candidatus Moranbacteria bacterium]
MKNKQGKNSKLELDADLNMNAIIKENSLQLIEVGSFLQKKHIARVKNAKGDCFILKAGRIEPFQVELLKTAKKIESQLCFKVPVIVKQGDGWILMKEIEGKFLNDFYKERPEWCADVCKKIADDYKLVIQEIQKEKSFGNLLGDGQEWFFSKLDLWSKPIVDTGLIDFSEVQEIKKECEAIISKKRESFFSWVHGNIIGDHIIISGKDVYLLDLNAVPRIGGEYYDFLRALDFMFLKAKDNEKIFSLISELMKRYLSEFDEDEVKLVFAFRSIGMLGWDIIHNKDECGNIEEKKQLALKLIKRKY